MSDTNSESTAGKSRAVEKLEVEDEEQRHARMHNVLMELDRKTSHQTPNGKRMFDFGERRTFPVGPPTELLSRIQAFLPELAASNAELARRAKESPGSIDIEKLADENEYIEMNLGLGVFESRGKTQSNSTGNSTSAGHTLDVDMSNGDHASTDSTDSEMSEDYVSDSDTSSVDIISSFASSISRPIRPLPKRTSTIRPEIVVLNDGNSKDAGSSGSSEEGH